MASAVAISTKSVHVKEDTSEEIFQNERDKDIAEVTTQQVRWNLPRGYELIELCAS